MSNRKFFSKVTVTTTDGEVTQNFTLEYYVLERETAIDNMSVNTYGIEVLKRSKTDSGTLRVEYRKVFDIFCTETEAFNAVSVLASNTVTPVSVRDIIEQFIGTDEFECEEYEILAV